MNRVIVRIVRSAAILGALLVGGFMADGTPMAWQSKGTIISQACRPALMIGACETTSDVLA
jgi:hypothetical protein